MPYILDTELNTLDALRKFITHNHGEEITFVCPVELFASAGPVYWMIRKEELQQEFPHKKLVFWHNAGDMAGYALGALRMGVRHLIFTGSEKTFHKIKSIANHYQAIVIPSEKYLEN
jgi:hypothetical protein